MNGYKTNNKSTDKVEKDTDLSQFDYELPKELIAQHPLPNLDESRLLVLERKTQKIWHCPKFKEIERFLLPGDLLIYNDTKVFPAKLQGRRSTGGKVEILVVKKDGNRGEILIQTRGKIKEGDYVTFGDYQGKLTKGEDSRWNIDFEKDSVDEVLEKQGFPPLPPYINRKGEEAKIWAKQDEERYQTVYAKVSGAVAAPTAGLHFTKELLNILEDKGVEKANVTLHVGPGTFRPILSQDIRDHKMDSEYYKISEETAEKINKARTDNRRIIAIGTTSCRVLESLESRDKLTATEGWTNLYIYPGFKFKIISGMVTNFHMPKSTLLLLVATLLGPELTLSVYKTAVEMKYRFFSYGDAMLIV